MAPRLDESRVRRAAIDRLLMALEFTFFALEPAPFAKDTETVRLLGTVSVAEGKLKLRARSPLGTSRWIFELDGEDLIRDPLDLCQVRVLLEAMLEDEVSRRVDSWRKGVAVANERIQQWEEAWCGFQYEVLCDGSSIVR